MDAAGDRYSVAGLALEMLQARKRGLHFHCLLGKFDASYFDYFLLCLARRLTITVKWRSTDDAIKYQLAILPYLYQRFARIFDPFG